ncbi:MAG TPA: peptidase, partial [Pirellulaceae bacterium]
SSPNEKADAPPGLTQHAVEGFRSDESFEYWVQLPPEYDPRLSYPAIVTLHSADTTPELQIDWWAGAYDPALRMRLGQATRRGYIVIAPRWKPASGSGYAFSAREHAAVLFALRDACQRVAIDTDRVFLTGHSAGGDAAWDIGLAHPDLWAGVVPIVAAARNSRPDCPRYVTHYWPNARHLAFYFVSGEKDAPRSEWNATDFNRYFRRVGFDTMLVDYRGRGHEHFGDEIQRVFRWMEVHRRQFFPDEFEVVTRRLWDNFFWYVELDGIQSRAMIDPAAWPAPRAARPLPVSGSVRERKAVVVEAKNTDLVTVYVSPEMVDFGTDVAVTINGRKKTRRVLPDPQVLLEDARTRGDRQHPFWAKVTSR